MAFLPLQTLLAVVGDTAGICDRVKSGYTTACASARKITTKVAVLNARCMHGISSDPRTAETKRGRRAGEGSSSGSR